jgi:hypothetical protein
MNYNMINSLFILILYINLKNKKHKKKVCKNKLKKCQKMMKIFIPEI